MQVALGDEDRQIRRTVRSFVEREVMPWEQELIAREIAGGLGLLTATELGSLQRRARQAGLWGIDTPEEYGGADLDPFTQALIFTEYGRTFVNFKFGGSAPEILYGANDDQKREYLVPTIEGERIQCFALSEPGTGSDARNLRTTAVRSGDDWVIDGEKTWVTYGNDADYAIVFARTSDDGGTHGITAFLVDREMGWKSTPIPMMGAHDPATVSFEGVRVPSRNVFGEVDRGFPTAMRFIHRNRYQLPARWGGNCARLIQMAIAHATARETFGKPLSQRENIRWMIADAETRTRAITLLSYHAACLHRDGKDYRHAANAAKLFGAITANEIVDDVVQIHGAMGYAKELPVERWYRDLRVARIYEGSDEMQRLANSRNLLAGHTSPGELF